MQASAPTTEYADARKFAENQCEINAIPPQDLSDSAFRRATFPESGGPTGALAPKMRKAAGITAGGFP